MTTNVSANPPANDTPDAAANAPAGSRGAVTGDLREDTRRAAQHAMSLGAGLVVTTALGFAVRLVLPRYLGPDQFGAFQFADAFTTSLLVLASLGLETYIRKEVAVKHDHADDFFAGTLLIQLAISLLVTVGALWFLAAGGRAREVLILVALMAGTNALMRISSQYGALLQAVGTVDGLSLLSVLAKAIWGGSIFVVFFFGGSVVGVAATMMGSEAIRAALLTRLVRRSMGLRWRVDMVATRRVIVVSLPFFLQNLALVVNMKSDAAVMSFLSNDREVGWYGAAGVLTGMSLLLSPLIGWVLLPLGARAAARSDDDLNRVASKAMELILMVAIPTSLTLYLVASDLVRVAFGAAFVPAGPILAATAPIFVLTYAGMVSATVLMQVGRGWAVTTIVTIGMLLSIGLNFLMIPWGLRHFGTGGAGLGAAVTLMLTETFATATMTWLLGRRAFNERTTAATLKMFGAAGVTVALDYALHSLGMWRYPIDLVLYAALCVVSGAVRVNELQHIARQMLSRRRGGGSGD